MPLIKTKTWRWILSNDISSTSPTLQCSAASIPIYRVLEWGRLNQSWNAACSFSVTGKVLSGQVRVQRKNSWNTGCQLQLPFAILLASFRYSRWGKDPTFFAPIGKQVFWYPDTFLTRPSPNLESDSQTTSRVGLVTSCLNWPPATVPHWQAESCRGEIGASRNGRSDKGICVFTKNNCTQRLKKNPEILLSNPA